MKCFKSSFWLTVVCICEGAFYDDLCDVYVICTPNCTGPRVAPPPSTVLILMKRLLSNCLVPLPLISIYCFPFTYLNLPATTQHLYVWLHVRTLVHETDVPLLLKTCSAAVT